MADLQQRGVTGPAHSESFGLSSVLFPALLSDLSEPTLAQVRAWIAQRMSVGPNEVALGHTRAGAPTLRVEDRPRPISLARSGGWTIVALADRAVGVDIERVGPVRDPPWHVVAPAESAVLARLTDPLARHTHFLRCWVVKEALVKARGTGFVADPSVIAVSFDVVGKPSVEECGKRIALAHAEVGEITLGAVSERFVWASVLL